jgi:amidophosphoribosyltransferase
VYKNQQPTLHKEFILTINIMAGIEHLPTFNQPADPEMDKLRGKCGVVAVLSAGGNAPEYVHLALEALQHRGQEAAGATINADFGLITVKDEGLVHEVLGKAGERITILTEAEEGIGHVRYGTSTNNDSFGAAQPIAPTRETALAQNGDIVNKIELAQEHGINPDGLTDTQVISEVIGNQLQSGRSLEETLLEILPKIKGAFSMVMIERMLDGSAKLIAIRDDRAIRPLARGKFDDGSWIVASETTALDIVGAQHDGDIQPGTFEIIDKVNGVKTYHWSDKDKRTIDKNRSGCAIEFAYKASPDSIIDGVSVYSSRARAGEILAAEQPVDADIVIGVPDSGRSAAYGYAKAMNLDNPEGLFKRRYSSGNRTFINPSQANRRKALKLKFNPLPEVIAGQRLVVVDDSIIRGNTTRQVVEQLRGAGAIEVHMRIATPMNKYPCYYGMDTGDPSQLIANRMSLEDMTKYFGLDSLAFLSADGLREAIAPKVGEICRACMTGEYPIPIAGYAEPMTLAGRV